MRSAHERARARELAWVVLAGVASVTSRSARADDTSVAEVQVRGAKSGDATAPHESIGGREVRQVPGAFGDAFRAIESLPGVTPMFSGLPYFFVRGAPPGNTGFFVDGVRVPGLFHLGVGPAVIHPALVERVDLYKAAYPARFGRWSGGILSAETTRPAERTRADWTLRLFDAGALVEARGEDVGAGRRSARRRGCRARRRSRRSTRA